MRVVVVVGDLPGQRRIFEAPDGAMSLQVSGHTTLGDLLRAMTTRADVAASRCTTLARIPLDAAARHLAPAKPGTRRPRRRGAPALVFTQAHPS